MPRRLLRNGVIVTVEWLRTSDGDVPDDSPLMLAFAEWWPSATAGSPAGDRWV